ncbi:MAG: DUF3221 domain-containing protein [Clostridia bacterium]|nr:DUF3221 domain-containing protein [Clostridia bacterium]
MKRALCIFSIILLLSSALLIFGCGDSEVDNKFIMEAIVQGVGEKIEVEVINSDYAFGIYWVLLAKDAKIYNSSNIPISKEGLSVGDRVEITYGGQVMMSYPPQIVAQSIKICE